MMEHALTYISKTFDQSLTLVAWATCSCGWEGKAEEAPGHLGRRIVCPHCEKSFQYDRPPAEIEAPSLPIAPTTLALIDESARILRWLESELGPLLTLAKLAAESPALRILANR